MPSRIVGKRLFHGSTTLSWGRVYIFTLDSTLGDEYQAHVQQLELSIRHGLHEFNWSTTRAS